MAESSSRSKRSKKSANPAPQLSQIEEEQPQVKLPNIFPERNVDISSLHEYEVAKMSRLNWDSLLEHSYFCSSIVRDIYRTFEYTTCDNKAKVKFSIQRKRFSMTREEFATRLQIPNNGIYFYNNSNSMSAIDEEIIILNPRTNEPDLAIPRSQILLTITKPDVPLGEGYTLLSSSLKKKFRLWHKILCYNVCPKAGDRQKVSSAQALLLYCIEKQIPINLAHIICSRIRDIVGTKFNPLYPCLLTKLGVELGCRIISRERILTPFNKKTVSQMFRAEDVVEEPEEAAAMDDEGPAAQGGDFNSFMPYLQGEFGTMRQLQEETMRRQQEHYDYMMRLDERVDRNHQEVLRRQDEHFNALREQNESHFRSAQQDMGSMRDFLDQRFSTWSPFGPPSPPPGMY